MNDHLPPLSFLEVNRERLDVVAPHGGTADWLENSSFSRVALLTVLLLVFANVATALAAGPIPAVSPMGTAQPLEKSLALDNLVAGATKDLELVNYVYDAFTVPAGTTFEDVFSYYQSGLADAGGGAAHLRRPGLCEPGGRDVHPDAAGRALDDPRE